MNDPVFWYGLLIGLFGGAVLTFGIVRGVLRELAEEVEHVRGLINMETERRNSQPKHRSLRD